MSNKTQLQTNNTELSSLIEAIRGKAAGSGGAGGGSIETCEVTFINNSDEGLDCYGFWATGSGGWGTYQAYVMDGSTSTATTAKNAFIIIPSSNVKASSSDEPVDIDKYAISNQSVVMVCSNSSVTITIS